MPNLLADVKLQYVLLVLGYLTWSVLGASEDCKEFLDYSDSGFVCRLLFWKYTRFRKQDIFSSSSEWMRST
jgi:hypothetical protein